MMPFTTEQKGRSSNPPANADVVYKITDRVKKTPESWPQSPKVDSSPILHAALTTVSLKLYHLATSTVQCLLKT